MAEIITGTYKKGNQVVVVLSAQGDTTDDLLAKAAEINPSGSKREMDMLLNTGEQMSIPLMAMAIERLGFPVVSLTGLAGWAWKPLAAYGAARIKRVSGSRIQEELDQNKIVLVAGFQGINKYGDVTTLGPRRLRHHCSGAGSGTAGGSVSDLYRCGRRIYRRSPQGARRPEA